MQIGTEKFGKVYNGNSHNVTYRKGNIVLKMN